MPPLGKLMGLQLAAHDRKGLEVALVQCWKGLRAAGYSRLALGAAFFRAWVKGDIRVDPSVPKEWPEGQPPKVVITPKAPERHAPGHSGR